MPEQSCQLTTVNGCDSIAVLNLTIIQADTSYTDVTACNSYTWNNNTYTQSGVYTYNGGDTSYIPGFTYEGTYNGSNYYLSQTPSTWTEANQICNSLGGNLVTITSQEENDFLQDIISSLALQVDYNSNIENSGCWIGLIYSEEEGLWNWVTDEQYDYTNWNTGEPNGSGDYCQIYHDGPASGTYLGYWDDTGNMWPHSYILEMPAQLNSVNGCDSVAVLNLTVTEPDTSFTNVVACDSYTWNGINYDSSGVYYHNESNYSNVIYEEDFSNGLGSEWSDNSNMFFDHPDYGYIAGEYGSESLNLSLSNMNIGDSVTISFDLLIFGTWDGSSHPTAINAPDLFTLSVNNSELLNATFSNIDAQLPAWSYSCPQSYPDDYGQGTNTALTGSIYYSDSFVATDCDYGTGICTGVTSAPNCGGGGVAIYNITKTFYNNSNDLNVEFSANLGTVYPQPILTNGNCDEYWSIDNISLSSFFTDSTLPTVNECDSIIALNLTINESNTGVDPQEHCDEYTWIDGVTYTESNNTATHVLTNANDCDSVVTLDLTLNYSTLVNEYHTACDSYDWNGSVYNETGSYTYMSTNAAGCPETNILTLTINESNTGVDPQEHCDEYTWIDGVTYTESNNTATHVLTNANDCDSVVTLDLTLNYSTLVNEYHTACDSYDWNGSVYNETGSYTYMSTNAAGCPETNILTLTINESNTGVDPRSIVMSIHG